MSSVAKPTPQAFPFLQDFFHTFGSEEKIRWKFFVICVTLER